MTVKRQRQQAAVAAAAALSDAGGSNGGTHRQEEAKDLVSGEHKAGHMGQVREGEGGGWVGGHEG